MSSDRVLMPKELTAENGAKAALIGEFKETLDVYNPDYANDPDDEPEFIKHDVQISWTTIKKIYKRCVELLGEEQ